MYNLAIYLIKSLFALIMASMGPPQNLEQALTTWAFFMALNSLIFLINLSFVLHEILLMHFSTAPHTKKSIGFKSGEFGGQMSGGKNQQSCCSAKVAFFLMYGRVPSPVAAHMACQQPPYISRAVSASLKSSGAPLC